VKVLAREGKKLAALVKENNARVRDRSRQMGQKLRLLSRTIRRRSGEAKAEVLSLTEQTGELLERSVKEARKLANATSQIWTGWSILAYNADTLAVRER
jgi:hypothetical protein